MVFIKSSCLLCESHGLGQSPDPPDPPDRASSAAARDPPATRAGGQDDSSYTNSLKLYFPQHLRFGYPFSLSLSGGAAMLDLINLSDLDQINKKRVNS